MKREEMRLGIYEKALPHNMSWKERLLWAKELGFDFVEISIDEDDERLKRLLWSQDERLEIVEAIFETGIKIPSLCLSGHRRFPLGSKDPKVRERALLMMEQAIVLAVDLGVRVIQIASYDEYYHPQDETTDSLFRSSFKEAELLASKYQVSLAFEVMDTTYLNSIEKFVELKKEFPSCWIGVYPDVGNLKAWGNDLRKELTLAPQWIQAIHLKDTLPVTKESSGKFKEVPFGAGCVDFTEVFTILKEINYRGPLLIEMWSGNKSDPKKEILEAKSFIFDHMRKAQFLSD